MQTATTENNNLHRAYERYNLDMTQREQIINNKFDELLKLGKEIESPLLRQMKPIIVLSLKWKFDFLFKTLESPFELEADLDYWIKTLNTFKVLGNLDWFPLDGKSKIVDVWNRTADGFDLGWTTTTEGERFAQSKKIAIERMDQIFDMLGGPKYFDGKTVLDSGCGPGRYISVLSDRSKPAKICGMDQGSRLMDVLKTRFHDAPHVEITQGTCEKLEFKSESFDFVFSNGVIHHTKSDLLTMLKDHARVLKPGGSMFVMLVGKGGMELKIWEFIRGFLNDVPLNKMIETFGESVHPLRLQGIVDHMYGEYQETDRDTFEEWCKPLFKKIERVPGIDGLDVTPEIYANDPYAQVRFGTGNLRYLLQK